MWQLDDVVRPGLLWIESYSHCTAGRQCLASGPVSASGRLDGTSWESWTTYASPPSSKPLTEPRAADGAWFRGPGALWSISCRRMDLAAADSNRGPAATGCTARWPSRSWLRGRWSVGSSPSSPSAGAGSSGWPSSLSLSFPPAARVSRLLDESTAEAGAPPLPADRDAVSNQFSRSSKSTARDSRTTRLAASHRSHALASGA